MQMATAVDGVVNLAGAIGGVVGVLVLTRLVLGKKAYRPVDGR
jgi:hypothetical protein